jgi:hypothetical protein
METNQIQDIAHRRMTKIEESYGQYHTPPHIYEYYLLNFLLHFRSMDRYFNSFGFQPIDEYSCQRAKDEMNLPPLSPMERDVIKMLNKKCQEKEYESRKFLPTVVKNVQCSNDVGFSGQEQSTVTSGSIRPLEEKQSIGFRDS